MAIKELETPVDAVVIGQADEIHAASLGHAIDVLRMGVAIARAEPRESAREAGVIRMHVQVRLHQSLLRAA
jgi:hypothetical protein